MLLFNFEMKILLYKMFNKCFSINSESGNQITVSAYFSKILVLQIALFILNCHFYFCLFCINEAIRSTTGLSDTYLMWNRTDQMK